MIVPKIKLLSKIDAKSAPENAPVYRLTIYIDKVEAYDTETGEITGALVEIPLELFLYIKYNTIPVDTDITETVELGKFIRLFEPEDLNSLNYTMFGTEKLLWSDPSDARLSTPKVSILPSTNPVGANLLLDTADRAIAPKQTHCRSGYYKSRVFIYTTKSAQEAELIYQDIKRRLEVFIDKYIARTMSANNQGTMMETEII